MKFQVSIVATVITSTLTQVSGRNLHQYSLSISQRPQQRVISDDDSCILDVRGGAAGPGKGWFGMGKGNDDDDDDDNNANNKDNRHMHAPPPESSSYHPQYDSERFDDTRTGRRYIMEENDYPPPPPPMNGSWNNEAVANSDIDEENESDFDDDNNNDDNEDFDFPPPPPPNQMYQEQDEQDQPQPPPFNYYNDPYNFPPPPNSMYGNDQQFMYPPNDQFYQPYETDPRYMEDGMIREEEQDLLIQNLTDELAHYQNKSATQLDEIDNLTDTVLNLSNELAHEQILLKEIKHNSTMYYKMWKESDSTLENMRESFTELEKQKSEFEEKENQMIFDIEEQEKQIFDLSLIIEEFKETQKEMELYKKTRKALHVSLDRLEDDFYYDNEVEDKKRVGFFQGLFNILFFRSSSTTSSKVESDNKSIDRALARKLKATQNLTRNTLTKALQNTRELVEDLEYQVSQLEQNNTSLSEVISSRDKLVKELHGRINIFEEDKLVLKAALRQLQREMKDEIGPARQKLEDELRDACEDIQGLQSNLKSIKQSHAIEKKKLQEELGEKQSQLNSTMSEMNTIGVYVDMLEERLANFTVTKHEFMKEREGTKSQVLELVSEIQKEREKWRAEKTATENKLVSLKQVLSETQEELTRVNLQFKTLQEEEQQWKNALSEAEERAKIAAQKCEIVGDVSSTSPTMVQIDVDVPTLDEKEENSEDDLKQDQFVESDDSETEETEEESESEFESQSESETDTEFPKLEADTEIDHNNAEAVVEEEDEKIEESLVPPSLPDLDADASNNNNSNALNGSVSMPNELKVEPTMGETKNTTPDKTTEPIPNQMPRPQNKPVSFSPPPFRNVRKAFSRVTGIHGMFDPQYKDRLRIKNEIMRRRAMMQQPPS